MKFLVIFPIILSLILIPALGSDVFADKTYNIKIPSGAASPDAPYFWSSEKDGSTTGNIEISVNDSITWGNGDTAAHTVTSGTTEGGPAGVFDSGLFGPGKSFTFKFTEKGKYPYFCMVHPWMVGEVTVVEGLQVIPEVGSKVGDGKTTFDVQYKFNRLVSSAKVDQHSKSITFTLVGKPTNEDNTLIINMPKKLLDGPYVMFLDGEEKTDFKESKNGGITTLTIPVGAKSEQLTIIGTAVVPEFGTIAIFVLVVSIVSVIALKSRLPSRMYRF